MISLSTETPATTEPDVKPAEIPSGPVEPSPFNAPDHEVAPALPSIPDKSDSTKKTIDTEPNEITRTSPLPEYETVKKGCGGGYRGIQ